MPREKLSVVLPAYAKINLFLDIEGTREDGYHLLSMVNAKISVHDDVACSLTLKPKIVLTCSDPELPTDERNMAYQAAARFREQSRLAKGVAIDITKRIPMGAGLAGGSSDAASVLHALSQLTYDQIPKGSLYEIGKGIGADVSFFLEPGLCVCSGIGERVIPIYVEREPDEIPLFGVLCSPKQHVSTVEAYRMWDRLDRPKHSSARPLVNALMVKEWRKIPKLMFNAFEPVIFENYPVIKKDYQTFKSISPTPPRLTGSGSNLFSLHVSKEEADDVVERLLERGLTATGFHLVL